MKKQLLFLIAILASFGATAQKAALTGQLYEMNDGKKETLPFANVAVKGTTKGTTTDFDGNFTLTLGAGTYDIEFSFIGYQAKVQQITLAEGEQKVVNVELSSDTKLLEDVVVQAKADRQSETVLLLEQKKANTITQSIGAKELSRKGVSDVASGLTKVSGVSLVGSKQLFVRGLGDRYNNATLNGLPIASPDPELKMIPLDIFPTQVVKNLGVNKAFAPVMYADFSGGNINIETKDYPEESFVNFNVSGGLNSQTTFQGYKSMPATMKSLPSSIASKNYIFNYQKEPVFSTGFDYGYANAPSDHSISVTAGTKTTVGDLDLGFLIAAGYDKEYRTVTDKFTSNLNSQGERRTDYTGNEFTADATTNILANAFARFNENNSIQLNSLLLNKTEDDLYEFEGYYRDQGADLLIRRATHRQHSLLNNQLTGKHEELLGNEALNLDWGAGFALARSIEPDRRQLVFTNLGEGDYRFNVLDESSNNRFFSELNENELSGRVNLVYDFSKKGEDSELPLKIEMGGQFKMKNREFSARQFNYNLEAIRGSVDPDNVGSIFNDDSSFEEGTVRFKEQPNIDKSYGGELDVYAGYANASYDVVPNKFNLTAGLRAEYGDQRTMYKTLANTSTDPREVAQLKGLELFPSMSAKLSPSEKANVRLAASRTITRPEFKESAPFLYEPLYGGVQSIGNADIENAFNYNVDLKYELFPNTGELFAVSVFGKYLDSPIERVLVSSSTSLATYVNTDKAYVAGVELEYNKTMASILGEGAFLSDLSFGLNTSLIYSQININEGPNVIITNQKRALQGASPYLVNFDMNYPVKFGDNMESMITMTYNVFGKRIAAAGTLGLGDMYEQPVNTVDLMIKNKLYDKLNLNLSLKNLLNPTVLYTQESVSGEKITVEKFKKGMNVGLSLSYELR